MGKDIKMKISTKGRYALRMMCDIAANDNGSAIPLKEIAARQNISVKYLEQIVILLSRAGFVKSVRGAQGGYKLTNPPKYYTVGMILRLTEGSLAPVSVLRTMLIPADVHRNAALYLYGSSYTVRFAMSWITLLLRIY